MVETSLNTFDLVVFGVLGLSALLSFFRGFVREFLSLGAWVGAAVITLYAFPHVADLMKSHVKSESIASGFAAMGTFMLSLLAFSIFNSVMLRYMKPGAEVGLLDNGLGLIFGLFRGAMLVSLGYFIMTITVKKDDYPEYLEQSMSHEYVEKGAAWIATVSPDYFSDIVKPSEKTPALDKVLSSDDDEEESGSHWQSMDELQKRMREGKGE
jgi:membrane protein required for colicin V production